MARAKIITASLNVRGRNSISDCIKQLEEYKVELNDKTRLFVNKLAEAGIRIADLNGGYNSDGYEVLKRDESTGDEICIVVYTHDTKKVVSRWYHTTGHGKGRKTEVVTAELSPAMLDEFGAGWLAFVPTYPVTGNTPTGVGRGSWSDTEGFGHAHGSDWHWTPEGTNRVEYAHEHEAEMTPSHPMYEAVCYMLNEGNRIAREVFG